MSGDEGARVHQIGTPAAAAAADTLKVTERAARRADEVLASTAGTILTREGRYYQRLLHQIVTSIYVEGAMAGAAIATQRAVAGMSGDASIQREPELERVAEEPPRGVELVELPAPDTLDMDGDDE